MNLNVLAQIWANLENPENESRNLAVQQMQELVQNDQALYTVVMYLEQIQTFIVQKFSYLKLAIKYQLLKQNKDHQLLGVCLGVLSKQWLQCRQEVEYKYVSEILQLFIVYNLDLRFLQSVNIFFNVFLEILNLQEFQKKQKNINLYYQMLKQTSKQVKIKRTLFQSQKEQFFQLILQQIVELNDNQINKDQCLQSIRKYLYKILVILNPFDQKQITVQDQEAQQLIQTQFQLLLEQLKLQNISQEDLKLLYFICKFISKQIEEKNYQMTNFLTYFIEQILFVLLSCELQVKIGYYIRRMLASSIQLLVIDFKGKQQIQQVLNNLKSVIDKYKFNLLETIFLSKQNTVSNFEQQDIVQYIILQSKTQEPSKLGILETNQHILSVMHKVYQEDTLMCIQNLIYKILSNEFTSLTQVQQIILQLISFKINDQIALERLCIMQLLQFLSSNDKLQIYFYPIFNNIQLNEVKLNHQDFQNFFFQQFRDQSLQIKILCLFSINHQIQFDQSNQLNYKLLIELLFYCWENLLLQIEETEYQWVVFKFINSIIQKNDLLKQLQIQQKLQEFNLIKLCTQQSAGFLDTISDLLENLLHKEYFQYTQSNVLQVLMYYFKQLDENNYMNLISLTGLFLRRSYPQIDQNVFIFLKDSILNNLDKYIFSFQLDKEVNFFCYLIETCEEIYFIDQKSRLNQFTNYCNQLMQNIEIFQQKQQIKLYQWYFRYQTSILLCSIFQSTVNINDYESVFETIVNRIIIPSIESLKQGKEISSKIAQQLFTQTITFCIRIMIINNQEFFNQITKRIAFEDFLLFYFNGLKFICSENSKRINLYGLLYLLNKLPLELYQAYFYYIMEAINKFKQVNQNEQKQAIDQKHFSERKNKLNSVQHYSSEQTMNEYFSFKNTTEQKINNGQFILDQQLLQTLKTLQKYS